MQAWRVKVLHLSGEDDDAGPENNMAFGRSYVTQLDAHVGFKASSAEFVEAGIPHVEVR